MATLSEALESRLLELLNQSDSPLEEMKMAEGLLSEADLYHGPSVTAGTPPREFAARVFQGMEMRARVRSLRFQFKPKAVETVEDLIVHLLPAGSE